MTTTRYFCPLDCGWHHDQDQQAPGALHAALPIGRQVELMILGDMLTVETVIKQHLEEHDLVEWVQAVTKLKRDAAAVDQKLHDHGISYPLGARGVREMAVQRDSALEELRTAEAERDRLAALAEARQRVINRLAREAQTAEAAVERVREWLSEWGPQLPDGACHTLGQALDGDQLARRYASRVNAPLRPATVAALNEHLASGDHPVRKVSRRAEPLPAIDDHNYVGTPTVGQRCQDGPAGATCGGPFEQHVSREPCYHLDSKQLGARPGDLSLWCACGAQVFPGLRTTPNNPPAGSNTADNPEEQA